VAGRPPLRIGQYGKISRTKLSNGAWLARCRYRGIDGVTRIVERRGTADEFDQYGKLAEDALIEALKDLRPPAVADEITPDTPVNVLIDRHLERLADDDRSHGLGLAGHRRPVRSTHRPYGGVDPGGCRRLVHPDGSDELVELPRGEIVRRDG
jgi:hypothetical protein